MKFVDRDILRVLLLVGSLAAFDASAAEAQQKAAVSQAATAERLKALEEKVAGMSEVLDILLQNDPPRLAWLDCTDKNFRELRLGGSTLSVFVVCDTIEPYLEGHRVKLRVGNPYSFDLDGLKGTLWHGQEGLEAFKSQRRVAIYSAQRLRSGSWLPIEIVANPSKASEFRVLGVELSMETVIPGRLSP